LLYLLLLLLLLLYNFIIMCYSEEGGEADGRKSETESQSAGSTGATSEDSEPMWRPGTISDFKVMMNEQEFNIKLVEMKQDVSCFNNFYSLE
jgi:hypothetical protein